MEKTRHAVRLACAVVALVTLPTMWTEGVARSRAAAQVAAPQPRRWSRPLRELPSNVDRDWGSTSYDLESRGRRMTAHFDDAVVTATRETSGDTAVDVSSHAGVRLGKATLGHETRMLDFEGGRGRTRTALAQKTKATLDWTAIQSYLMAVEGPTLAGRANWREGFLREPGTAGDPNERASQLSTDFGDGLVATTYRRGRNLAEAMRKGTPYLVTVLTQGDAGIGMMQWHPGRQELIFHFPGVSDGKVSAQRLADWDRGWSFTPTMAWANVQAMAFYSLRKSQQPAGQVAANAGCGSRETRGTMFAILSMFSPTLHAQDTNGCDGLHWLDGSIYRQCCDRHDQCYLKYGCGEYSWIIPMLYPWQCTACNLAAAACFITEFEMCEMDPPCSCETNWGGYWDSYLDHCFIDPITISLENGNADLHLTAAEDGVWFDPNGKGRKQKLAWTYPGRQVGFLVLDRNGNGRIDDGTELFGNNTVLASGEMAAHGFEALKDLDGGDASDGAVTPSDPWYSSLRVWVDRNHNGVSEQTELMSLDEAGITELSTKYSDAKRIDRNGNTYPYSATATFESRHGTSTPRTFYDVFLQTAE